MFFLFGKVRNLVFSYLVISKRPLLLFFTISRFSFFRIPQLRIAHPFLFPKWSTLGRATFLHVFHALFCVCVIWCAGGSMLAPTLVLLSEAWAFEKTAESNARVFSFRGLTPCSWGLFAARARGCVSMLSFWGCLWFVVVLRLWFGASCCYKSGVGKIAKCVKRGVRRAPWEAVDLSKKKKANSP